MTVLAILVLTALSAVAAETAGSGKVVSGSATSTASAMPQCFEDEKDLAEIKRVQKANSKSAHKYDGYGRLFEKAAISDDEILQRLIYAEVVAGGCGEDSQKAVTPIAEVIVNRVKKRQGDIRSVVFARNQFASSLNIYSESAYKHFLCPRDKQLWMRSLARRMTLGQENKSPKCRPMLSTTICFNTPLVFNPRVGQRLIHLRVKLGRSQVFVSWPTAILSGSDLTRPL